MKPHKNKIPFPFWGNGIIIIAKMKPHKNKIPFPFWGNGIIIAKMKPHKNKIPFPYRGNGIIRDRLQDDQNTSIIVFFLSLHKYSSADIFLRSSKFVVRFTRMIYLSTLQQAHLPCSRKPTCSKTPHLTPPPPPPPPSKALPASSHHQPVSHQRVWGCCLVRSRGLLTPWFPQGEMGGGG